ncbi:hypothetical protein [Staphylococcus massiliensis]|nr:hypothetical protein [Staphylococcus massiliensis]MCG3400584.1 hypothetical protein [Staphylococcus massiliensis]MCG3401424.1 hypothetical protein [Staphylococcus massiliensis]MCG3411794.1 hypothetical protein [Staphylococcus massiliensis]
MMRNNMLRVVVSGLLAIMISLLSLTAYSDNQSQKVDHSRDTYMSTSH